jgi:hypothetical protein
MNAKPDTKLTAATTQFVEFTELIDSPYTTNNGYKIEY